VCQCALYSVTAEFGMTYAAPFRALLPRDEFADFYSKISDPISLDCIMRRVKDRYYRTRAMFLADVNILYSNALSYSGEDTRLDAGWGMAWGHTRANMIAVGANNGQIMSLSVDENGGGKLHTVGALPNRAPVEDIAFMHQGNKLCAVGGEGTNATIFDCRERDAPVLSWRTGHVGDCNCVDIDSQDRHILTGGDGGNVHLWDIRMLKEGARPLKSYEYHKSSIPCVKFDPLNDNQFGVVCSGGYVSIWNTDVKRETEEQPEDLMFLHCNLDEPQQMEWHPALEGLFFVSHQGGIDVVRPFNLTSSAESAMEQFKL
ncbi:hypothetical protein KIPB_008253, partial [Kipferlia bialata]